MATSEKSSNLSAEKFAKEIIDEMSQSPLLIDVKNEIEKHRELGIADDKIKKILINSFKITDAGYQPTSVDEDGIIVLNMPQKYNKINWQ